MSTALVSTSPKCPLCHSTARREVDLLIRSRHLVAREEVDTVTGEIKEITSPHPGASFADTLALVHELLNKLGEPTLIPLTDLIIHSTQHPLVSELYGVQVRQESNLIFIGETVYFAPEPRQLLRALITVGANALLRDPDKIRAPFLAKAIELYWRMTGNAGEDDFLNMLRDKAGQISLESPLGAAFAERQRARGRNTPTNGKEEEVVGDSDLRKNPVGEQEAEEVL